MSSAIEWVDREFPSEATANVFADSIESSKASTLVAGPFVTGPYPGPGGEMWRVEYTCRP